LRPTELVAAIALCLLVVSPYAADKPAKPAAPAVTELNGAENMQKLLDTAANRLLVFDCYADWCMPCRMLAPLFEEVARENKSKARFFRINVDRNPEIASGLGASGIPYVLFVKNHTALNAITGVYPKEAYVREINRLSAAGTDDSDDTPDGQVVNGERVIRLTTGTAPGDLYVYRGETVKLVVQKATGPYGISIPQYKVAEEAVAGRDFVVTFKADSVGVFPIFCNGNCPADGGTSYGRVIVMPAKSSGGAMFTDVQATDAKKLIETLNPLLLDVRTPNEYYESHIEGAKLLPLQQLENRLSEITDYKDKPVIIYCRSGNRSSVAADILVRNHFSKLYNLKSGITGWTKAGLPVTKK
jgi:thioredoxin